MDAQRKVPIGIKPHQASLFINEMEVDRRNIESLRQATLPGKYTTRTRSTQRSPTQRNAAPLAKRSSNLSTHWIAPWLGCMLSLYCTPATRHINATSGHNARNRVRPSDALHSLGTHGPSSYPRWQGNSQTTKSASLAQTCRKRRNFVLNDE